MKQYLPSGTYEAVKRLTRKGEKLDARAADQVAEALKEWAVDRGCTHYTHWFQPMTGTTAEKHDSFIRTDDKGRVIEGLSGKELIQGEPDASSFPSGGLRSTFEARGYTIWDPTSPAFIVEYPHGNTLCIPSVFVSYSGDALDKKAPLLRSSEAVNKAALSMLELFSNKAEHVISTLGVEQEYFLIDRHYFQDRPDLMQAGRTLYGIPPAKHQQMEDQYFGNIPERAFAFMTEVEAEAYKLAIPLKTRHNEVAPNQFEVAPVFEEAGLAVDHNLILMDLMERVAARNGMACLFHEKPFARVNGSGKHCNWSLATDLGENLLNPGRTPESNLQFLTFLVATIKAVHDHSKELRAAIAGAGNDLRLGANEAPPAIISVFVGELLFRVLNDLAEGKVTQTADQRWISMGIDRIPEILRDNTDRNRTSPFAFTGNKFEFRAVGASATPATAITVLNTAVASSLIEIKKAITAQMSSGKPFTTAAIEVLRTTVQATRKVLFEGDNYSKEWQEEAARRGLPNLKTSPEAFPAILSDSSVQMFTELKVLSKRELESRFHINMEAYIKAVEIEAGLVENLAMTRIVPDAARYLALLTNTAHSTKEALGGADIGVTGISNLAKKVSQLIGSVLTSVDDLKKAAESAHHIEDMAAKGLAFVKVREALTNVRDHIDGLESIVDRTEWTSPRYEEMLIGL